MIPPPVKKIPNFFFSNEPFPKEGLRVQEDNLSTNSNLVVKTAEFRKKFCQQIQIVEFRRNALFYQNDNKSPLVLDHTRLSQIKKYCL